MAELGSKCREGGQLNGRERERQIKRNMRRRRRRNQTLKVLGMERDKFLEGIVFIKSTVQ